MCGLGIVTNKAVLCYLMISLTEVLLVLVIISCPYVLLFLNYFYPSKKSLNDYKKVKTNKTTKKCNKPFTSKLTLKIYKKK